MFTGTLLKVVAGCLFTLLALYASVIDVRARRIPNALVFLLGGAGLLFSLAAAPGLIGLLRGVGGLFVGLLIWLPFYALGWLGAGDVKFFAAAAAWLGPEGALEAALLSALVGGVLALVWLTRKRRVVRALRGLWFWTLGVVHARTAAPVPLPESENALPYGVALAVGVVLAGWYPGLLL